MHGIPKPTLVEGEEGYDLIGLGLQNNLPRRRTLQCATSFDGSSPFSAKAASTASYTLDGFQFDIASRQLNALQHFMSTKYGRQST